MKVTDLRYKRVFTLEDLAANQQGKISPRQRLIAIGNMILGLVLFSPFACIFVCPITVGVSRTIDFLGIFLLLVCFIAYGIAFYPVVADIIFGSVEAIEGQAKFVAAHKPQFRGSNIIVFDLHIGGKVLADDIKVRYALEPYPEQVFRVYYLPRSKTVLSFEPLPTP